MDGRDSERYVIASISCGRDHTLALLDDGRVFGWGGDGSGRMPANTAEYCSTSKSDGRAVELSPRHKLTSIAAGYGISLGVTTTNRVAVWGSNAAGIGGRRESIALATPQLLADIHGICIAAAGEYLFGAIDASGRVYSWGLNTEGALGRPTTHFNALPGLVASLSPASLLRAGKGYMLALTRDEQLYGWGNNAAGQLGLGHLSSVASPRPV